jgi:hypothetical protein
MSTPISLKEAERKVFRAATDDGLWDIFIACFAAEFAIGPFLSVSLGDFWASAVFLPFWGLAYFAIRVIRKRVVLPRIGEVKFGPARRAKLWNFTLIMLAFNCVSLIGGIAAWLSFGVVPGWVITAVFALIVLNGFCIAAYFLDLPRLYAYGVLAFLSFFVGELLYQYAHIPHHGLPVTFGFTALVILLTGVTRFIWFLRDNPPIPIGTASWEPE